MCVEWASDHFGLALTYIYSVDLHEDMRENDFYILIPSDLDL